LSNVDRRAREVAFASALSACHMFGPWPAVRSAERAKPPSATRKAAAAASRSRTCRVSSGADKLPGWDRWLPAAKVDHLLGMSLDRVHDYLGWSPHELDPHGLAAQSQAVRVVVMIAQLGSRHSVRLVLTRNW
jgi:hypothetical protein